MAHRGCAAEQYGHFIFVATGVGELVELEQCDAFCT